MRFIRSFRRLMWALLAVTLIGAQALSRPENPPARTAPAVDMGRFGTGSARPDPVFDRVRAGQEVKQKETPQAEESRRREYLRDMPLAGEALKKGERDRVRELLARHVPRPGQDDHRGWEWHYLDNLTQGQERVVFRAACSRGAVPIVSRDYRWLAVWGEKDFVLINISAGKQVAALEEKLLAPHSFTADGSAMWAHQNGNFVSWAVPSLKRLHSVSLQTRKGADTDGAAPSPDGGRVAIPVKSGEGKREIQIVDAKTDKEVACIRQTPESFNPNSYWRPMWSPDGKRIVTSVRSEKNEHFTQVWDAATGEQVFRVPGRIWPIAWGTDPNQLLVGDLPERVSFTFTDAAVWDVATGKSVLTLRNYRHQHGVFPRFPHDLHRWAVDGGRVRMTGHDSHWSTKVVYTWDVATGNLLDIEPAPPAPGTREVEMGRGDNPEVRIYEAGQDRGAERAIWWAGSSARPGFTWRSASEFALGTPPRAGVWSAETDSLRDAGAGWPSPLDGAFPHLGGGEHKVAWRPDGRAFIARNEVWDAEPGRTKPRLTLDYTTNTYLYPTSTAWAPDGKRVAVHWMQYGTNWLGIWNANTGVRELKFATGVALRRRVSWSPDGTRIVTQGEDFIRDDLTVARVWDATSGQLVKTLSGAHLDGALSWSSDGRFLANSRSSTGSNDVSVWDVTTGKQTVKHRRDGFTTLAWAPDGKRLATSQQLNIDVIDAVTGKVQQYLSSEGVANDQKLRTLGALAWSANGDRLAAVESSGERRAVLVWDTKTGKRIMTFSTPEKTFIAREWVDLDRPGMRVAVAVADHTSNPATERILTIDVDTGKEAYQPASAARWWNLDDPQLARFIQNDKNRYVELQRVGTAHPLGRSDPWTVFQDDYAYFATTSPDGKRVAWFPRSLSSGYPEPIDSHSLAPRILDASDGKVLIRLAPPEEAGRALYLSAVWNTEGTRVAGAHSDGRVVLWDAVSGKTLWTTPSLIPKSPQPKETRFAVAWSTDGKRLALAPTDYDPLADHNFVAILDATNGKVLTRVPGPPKGVSTLAWSQDGKRIAVAAHDTTVRVWDATGREEMVLRGHHSVVTGLSWNPTGTRLATADSTAPGSKAGEVRIWDGLTGQELLTLRGNTQVAWSTDGRRLAARHPGGDVSKYEQDRHGKAVPTVIVWDAGPGFCK